MYLDLIVIEMLLQKKFRNILSEELNGRSFSLKYILFKTWECLEVNNQLCFTFVMCFDLLKVLWSSRSSALQLWVGETLCT